MILAVSRFKVSNGRESDVKEAFLNRPHLVDTAQGFVEMETYTEVQDAAAFYLVTQWTDQESFRQWHASPAHHASHKGIPKGLKLDPTFTKVIVLERLAREKEPIDLGQAVADSGALLFNAVAESEAVHFIAGERDGTIRLCNPAAARCLGRSREDLIGSALGDFLLAPDAAKVQELIANGARDFKTTFLLNFVGLTNEPYTLVCRLDVQPSQFVLIGEAPVAEERALADGLQDLNNQFAVLLRENARKTRELAAAKVKLEEAIEELNRSHWHLRKVAEVLPICISCGKVKSGEISWQNVAEYFQNNSLFVSHGCCPDCEVKLAAAWEVK